MSTNPNAEWFYARNGAQTGPFELATLRAMVASGQLHAQDLVWCEGMAAWTPIGQVPAMQTGGFAMAQQQAAASQPTAGAGFGAPPGYASPSAYPPQHQGYAAQGGYASQPVGYNYDAGRGPSQQGLAIAGFVLSFLFPLLGLIFSIIALNGMKTNRNDEGKGFATAGLIISIVFFAIACLWFIVVFAAIGAAASGGH